MEALFAMLETGPGGPIGSQVILMIAGVFIGGGAALARGWNSPAREMLAIAVSIGMGLIVPMGNIGGTQAWVFPIFIGIIFIIVAAGVKYARG